MKKIIISTIVLFVSILNLHAIETNGADSIFLYKNKTVIVNDSAGKIVVKVRDQDNKEYKQVYEGVFSDDKSFEKWTVMDEWGINLPILDKFKKKRNRYMEAHWSGISWGFANFSNDAYAINNINGVSLKAEKSNELNLNIVEHILPIIGNSLGLTTGFGMTWRNYHLDLNQHLVEVNHIVEVQNAPVGINYTFSRFRTFGFTVPLLLEFQHKFGGHKLFFLSAGIVGNVNTFSSYRVKYEILGQGKINNVESKNLNINPLTFDYMAQIGYDDWSIFAKYSPISLFQSQKGPNVNAVSMGATLNF